MGEKESKGVQQATGQLQRKSPKRVQCRGSGLEWAWVDWLGTGFNGERAKNNNAEREDRDVLEHDDQRAVPLFIEVQVRPQQEGAGGAGGPEVQADRVPELQGQRLLHVRVEVQLRAQQPEEQPLLEAETRALPTGGGQRGQERAGAALGAAEAGGARLGPGELETAIFEK